MTFRQSVLTCLGPQYLFKFRGRASRSEYWWFALFTCLVNIASAVFWLFPPAIGGTFHALLGLALFPASLGVTVRRLHDRNLSGWWGLAPIGLLAMMAAGGVASPVVDILSFGLLVAYIVVLCMPSQPGTNRFGPDPSETRAIGQS